MTLSAVDTTLAQPLKITRSAFASRFWHALEQRRFVTTQCESCQFRSFPPRPICIRCGARAFLWIEHSGRGRLYSRTRVHAAGGGFAALAPYSVGIVDLEDGPRVLVRILPDASAAALDSEVQLVVLNHPDGPLLAATVASLSSPQR